MRGERQRERERVDGDDPVSRDRFLSDGADHVDGHLVSVRRFPFARETRVTVPPVAGLTATPSSILYLNRRFSKAMTEETDRA